MFNSFVYLWLIRREFLNKSLVLQSSSIIQLQRISLKYQVTAAAFDSLNIVGIFLVGELFLNQRLNGLLKVVDGAGGSAYNTKIQNEVSYYFRIFGTTTSKYNMLQFFLNLFFFYTRYDSFIYIWRNVHQVDNNDVIARYVSSMKKENLPIIFFKVRRRIRSNNKLGLYLVNFHLRLAYEQHIGQIISNLCVYIFFKLSGCYLKSRMVFEQLLFLVALRLNWVGITVAF